MTPTAQIIQGDCLEVMRTLDSQSVNTCVTSPPYYGLRDYGVDGQLGLEETPEAYVAKMVEVFREVKRILKDDGTIWVNIGDSYASGKGTCHNPGGGDDSLGKYRKAAGVHPLDRGNKSTLAMIGLKPKDLIGIPWMVAFALRADGWYLRSDIIWHKPNPMPESVTDRPTKSHEYLFLLNKKPSYYYDNEAIKEPSINPDDNRGSRGNRKRFPTETINGIRGPGIYPIANKRSVWTIPTFSYMEAHFATYPPKLIEPCILAGCPVGGTVFDPFTGSGTTGMVALEHGRNFIGIELNPDYCEMARKRIANAQMPLLATIDGGIDE